jgi:hypothetical protein
MEEIGLLLNEMVDQGIITDYALFGALAQMRYTEPVATLDAGVLVGVTAPERLDVLAPLYEFCKQRGFAAEGEGVRVGDWPVQFIPAFSPLTREAMERADTADFEGVTLRVVRADYLAAIALSVGRPKDWVRILSLLESGSVSRLEIDTLAQRHGLNDAWARFERKLLND